MAQTLGMQTAAKAGRPVKHAPRSREQWLRDVLEWRTSGQTAAEYAVARGIRAKTLTQWASVLRDEVTRAEQAPRGGPESFLPVRVVEAARKVRGPNDSPGQVSAEFEVVLGNGRSVRVPSAFNADALCRLLDAVEGRVGC